MSNRISRERARPLRAMKTHFVSHFLLFQKEKTASFNFLISHASGFSISPKRNRIFNFATQYFSRQERCARFLNYIKNARAYHLSFFIFFILFFLFLFLFFQNFRTKFSTKNFTKKKPLRIATEKLHENFNSFSF